LHLQTRVVAAFPRLGQGEAHVDDLWRQSHWVVLQLAAGALIQGFEVWFAQLFLTCRVATWRAF